MKSRILLLFSFLLILWSIVVVRGAFIQIVPNERLESLKRRQFETSIQIRARRGAILDRNGRELAASVPSYSLWADPKLIERPDRVADKLARVLHMRRSEFIKHLRQHGRRFVWLHRQLPEKQMAEIRAWNEPGLGFIEESKRIYPNGSLMAQTLGFVGTDGRGLEGLELQFDKQLRGGWKSVLLPRDKFGRPLLPNGHLLTDVPDGTDVQLTIDTELQFMLEQELQAALEQHGATRAMGVILDPRTFEILAMATIPTFDLNDALKFSNEVKRNRLVADAFEPGSTMKAFLMASALEKKVIRPNSKYFCENGRFKVGDRWITEADSHENFGWLTATEILAHSSNVGVTKIAFDLGSENLFEGLTRFGFGQRTGVDLPGEAKGIVNPLPWRPHLLANISFGQGITATPLQIAAAYAAIANGGTLKTPVIVKGLKVGEQEETFTKELNPRSVIDPSDDSTLKLMLTASTGEQSTGAKARIPGYLVAGKTGTAQKVDAIHGGYMPHRYISSFAGIIPAQDPRFVIYIAIDDPKRGYYGAEVAAPVFARIAQFAVRREGVPPSSVSEENVLASVSDSHAEQKRETTLAEKARAELMSSSANGDQFPSLLGLTLREAMARVKDKAPAVYVRGHGWVVRTVPSAGQTWLPGRPVTLVLENPD